MCNSLKVGYARVDITPEQYTNLGGNGQDAKRMCNKVLERIFGTCVAISDTENNTILYCPVDLVHAKPWFSTPIREEISEVTGVPVENIMINASHNHSGPSTSAPHLEAVKLWSEHLKKQMVKCAKEAMEDRKEAELFVGQREVPGMTFVRHYHMNDGTVAGPNSGSFASGVKDYISKADNQLQVIRFARKDARDVVLVNWQCHATSAGAGENHLALQGEYIYAMRNHLEGLTGTYSAFFQGAAGNLVPTTRIKGDSVVENNVIVYGRALAEHAVACLNENMVPVNGGPVRATSRIFQGKVDHSDDHLAEKAQAAWDRYNEYPYEQRAEATKQVLHPAGFNSFLHTMGIVRRSHLGETLPMPQWALCAGDIGFISAPYEMFCSNGMYIKEHSPFKMTFVVTCTNDSFDYMADDNAFNYDLYEINTRRYGRGTAERLAENFVEMLKELKQ